MIQTGSNQECMTNLGRREISDGVMEKFDVVVRQGTAGLQMRQTERFQAERGLSPAAYIGGSVEEMKRIPPKILTRVSVEMTPNLWTVVKVETNRTSRQWSKTPQWEGLTQTKSRFIAMSESGATVFIRRWVGIPHLPREAWDRRSQPIGFCRI